MATYLVYPHAVEWGAIAVKADEWNIDEPYDAVDFRSDDEIVATFFLHDIVGFVKK